ncbi:putative G patch domain-containing protein [Helianthus annuus]|uniref:G patch domain-containing protein n=1 Tax=Helianthus annuus TaxID=4232 RepID=A0A251UTH4_HELAN|nr:G patch domain-containing protein TGH [Helianthus annuus]KAF5807364.1 putative G patch domain-containing protein [Helianthus annuus]KAJ0924119.1 putative G patch domain-containing protein [Helianthus annuus]
MASDEEDFVFFGTPIEREEDTISRKKKSIAEASGQLRTLAPWKQEVRDEEGRRRFHGAFSGGFSAGYFNTVGSKEGWTPQTFTSSRKKRAEIKQQDLSNFLDDDEKAELEGNSLGTSMQFDTFGFTAAEIARKQSEKEQNERPSAIPGPAPDELVVPATDSIGVRLMLKMGWRRGQSIKSSKSTHYDARREARKAFLAFAGPEDAEAEDAMETAAELPTDDLNRFQKSTPVYVLNPKQDMYGLGYDPFKGAPEFRDNKRSHLPGNRESGHKKSHPKKDGLFSFKPRNVAPGFGIGALEELDAEDEDVYASGYDFEAFVEEVEEPSRLAIEDKKKPSSKQNDGVLPGFKAASNTDYQLERFDPPVVPKDFVPHHKFPTTLSVNQKLTEAPPPEVPPPVDNNLKVLIEGVATLVARCGTLFEELSREKNQSNPLFNFLNGGDGNDYYKRKLWEARQKHGDKTKPLLNEKVAPNAQKMSAETRGNILGEKPLNRTTKELKPVAPATDNVNLQFHLSDTFTEPALFVEPTEIAKPFQHDPAKQERFEQYLKEKYRGGLRTIDAGGSSKMSEAARARERLEFDTAAEAITQGKWGKESQLSSQQILGASTGLGLQFTSGGSEMNGVSQTEEVTTKSMFPKREEFQWRPAPILCKRFDLIDPYMGKPPPPPRSRSKLDSLIFMPDYVKAATDDKNTFSNISSPQVDENRRTNVLDAEDKVEVENVEVENVERPVDLYKAIFSDDSDDEDENINTDQPEDPTKKIEVANTALSRLMAGDFLESLGKELGLEVPPDQPYNPPEAIKKPTVQDIPQKHEPIDNDAHKNVSRQNTKELKETTFKRDEGSSDDEKSRKRSKRDYGSTGDSSDGYRDRYSSSRHKGRKKETKAKRDKSSSDDEKSRKRSKRDYDSASDSSDGYRDRHSSSRRKGRKKEHRKHSKHRHHESSSRSRHSADKEYPDSKSERRKRRD